MYDQDHLWLQVTLEEYRTLRHESVESIRNQHQVLVYGFALIGLLSAASSQVWATNALIPSLIFLFAVPSLASCFTFVWLGEVERMMRAGYHVAGLEEAINRRIGEV